MKMKFISVLICFTISFLYVFATDPNTESLENINVVMPPSPTASNFETYGNIPVNMANGLPNVEVPIYSVNSGQLSMPIVLSYHPANIKVKTRASWVGFGWSLFCGGMVTRSVNGLPDDFPNAWGETYDEVPTASSLNETNSTDFTLLQNIIDNVKEFEPDIFSYNVNGISGQFIFGNDGKIKQIPQTNNKITPIKSAGGILLSFIITDELGNKYYFEEKETSQNSIVTNDTRNVNQHTSSWLLTRILAANTKDEIKFHYTQHTIQYDNDISQSSSCLLGCESCASCSQPDCGFVIFNGNCNAISTSLIKFQIQAKKLSYIVSNNAIIKFVNSTAREDLHGGLKLTDIKIFNKDIGFTYNVVGELDSYCSSHTSFKNFQLNYSYFGTASGSTDPYGTDYGKRLKLDEVVRYDGQEYLFNYNSPASYPPTNSKKIDHWGYYNGADNDVLIPTMYINGIEVEGGDRGANSSFSKIGLLNSIVYPTGGYTNFEFELNSYLTTDPAQVSGTVNYYASQEANGQVGCEILGKDDIISPNYETSCPNSIVDMYINVPSGAVNPTLKLEVSDTKDSNGNPISFGGSKHDTPARYILVDYSSDGSIDEYYHPIGASSTEISLTPGQSYMVYLRAFVDPIVFANASASWGQPEEYDEETEEYLVNGGGNRIKKIIHFDSDGSKQGEYEYVYNNPTTNKSSGVLPSGSIFGYINATYNRTYVSCSGNFDGFIEKKYLNRNSSSSIPYSDVIYSHVSEYKIGPNLKLRTDNEFYVCEDNYGAGITSFWINNSWNRGQLKIKSVYKYISETNYELVSKDEYSYENYWNSANDQVMGLKVGAEVANALDATVCATNHIFEKQNYTINSFWRRLVWEEHTMYNSGNSVFTKTDYSYDNTIHKKPTEIKVTTSTTDKYKIIKNVYPDDFLDPMPGWVETLQTSHIIKPIETIEVISEGTNKVAVKGTRNWYNTYGEIYKIDNLESDVPLLYPSEFDVTISDANIPQEYEEKYTYAYNNHNISQISKTYDLDISYIWNYNNTYPVLKVEGLTYSQLQSSYASVISYLENINNLPQVKDYATVKSKVNSIKAQLATLYSNNGCMITFYTYAPNIGITSQTDARKNTTYYIYDDYGRLEQIIDNDGNILNTYEYNYSNASQ